MTADDRLFDYLDAWEAAYRAGDDPLPEKFAADAPDLWPDLRRRVGRRRQMLRFLDMDAPVGQTVDEVSTPSAAAPDRRPDLADLLRHLEPPAAAGELGRLGDYRLLDLIGQGGMGAVFRAEDRRLRRQVALKVMLPAVAARPAARQRFVREARAAAAVEHDNVLTIHYVGDDGPVPFIATQLLAGESLEARLRRGPVPFAETLRIAGEIAAGLAAAHARGLVHRDVKPGNIFLEAGTGRVKVLDFGLARAVDEADRLTQEGAVVGTPAYMAPEQAAGGAVDARADLFSLGCVVYEMLTGRRPFRGPTTFAILTALATARPPAPRDLDPAIPADLSDFAMSLLEKDPARRPASAGAVADRARALARTGPAGARIVVQPLPDENPWDTLAAGDPGARTRGADRAATTQMADPPARRRSPALRYALTAGGAVVVLGLAVGLLLKTRGGADPGPGPEVSKARKAEPPPAPEAMPVDATVWDRLDRAKIPLAERVVGQPAEVVGVYNSHRQRDWYSMLGLAVHPAGKYVLTGNQTGPYLRLWHPETLDLMATVRNPGGHTAPVFSRDGRRLATLSQMGRQINLWAADGKQPVLTTSHVVPDGGRCTYLAFTPSGETLLSMSEGRTPVYLWDLRADPPKPTPVPDSGPTETHYFHRLAVSPDGRRLAAVRGLGADGLGLWDLTDGPPRKLATFGRHQGPVSALSFSGDGARLYTGAVSNEVFVWDVTRSPPRELGQVGTWPGSGKTMFANGVFGVRETPDGKALLVADVAHVRLFEIAGGTYQFKSTVLFDHGPAFDLAVGPDGRTGYVSTAEGNAILAVRLEDGGLRRGPDPGTKKLYSPGGGHRFALTPGRAGFAYSTGPTVEAAELLDTGDWRTTTLIPDAHHQFHTALAWHPGLGRFETTGYNVRHGGQAGLLFRQAAGPAAELFVDKDAKNFRALARSPDGRLLAVGSEAGDLLLFVPAGEAYRVRHRFPKQDGAVTSVGFSADGQYLAAVAQGPVHVWDMSGPEPTLALSFRKKHDWAHLAFSPTGRVLAVTDNSQGFALVNLDDPKEGLHLLSNQRTSFAAFHPTKPWVAAAHLGVTVWNYQTNRVEQSWSWSFPGPVNSLAFTPEGRHLLTANGNSTVYVLRLEKLSAAAKP